MGGKKIIWKDAAKAQFRAIEQPIALRILHALAAFAATGEGDVKCLQDIEPHQFRLRADDYPSPLSRLGRYPPRDRRQA